MPGGVPLRCHVVKQEFHFNMVVAEGFIEVGTLNEVTDIRQIIQVLALEW